MRAERRTKKTGSGVEFADHRDYAPGDDFRYLDWHAYQRFDRLLIRLYEEEEDLSIYFIIDTSSSMGFGDGEKLRQAKRLVRGAGLRRASPTSTASRSSPPATTSAGACPTTRGKARIFRIFRFLERPAARAAQTDLGDAMKTFVAQHKRRGLAVLLSDLYDPAGFEQGINALRYNQFEPFVLHVVDPARGASRICEATCASTTARRAKSARSPSPRRCWSATRRAYESTSTRSSRFCTSRQVATSAPT